MARDRITWAVLTLLAAIAVPAWADLLEPRVLPQDARWYVHLDMTRLMATPMGHTIREQWLAMPDSRQKLAQIRLLTGMDPWQDIRSVTLHGPSADEAEAVAVIRAEADPAQLENTLALAQDYQVISHGDRKVHVWTPDDGKHDTQALCVVDPRTYVFGVSPDRVKNAVDAILRGDAARSPLAEPIAEDRWLEAAVTDLPNLPRMKDRQPWMNRILDLRLSLGGDAQRTVATLGGTLTTPEAAQQSKALLEGLKAMVELQVAEIDSHAVALMKNVTIQSEGQRLWIDAWAPTAQVIEMIKKGAQRREGEGSGADPGADAGAHNRSSGQPAPLGHKLDF